MPIKTLPSKINELGDAKLLGNFENGSPEWHQLRNEPGAVGGSDIAAISGLSKWESAITKWAKKTGQIPDEVKPNMSMKLGTKLETPILELFADEHPELEIYTTGTWANKANEWARANPDGLYKTATGDFGIVEVKFSRDFWNAPPQAYRAQILWYLKVFGLKQAKLVALAGSSYQEYDIEWDEFEAETLWSSAERFRNYCITNTMPDWDGSNSTFETVRQLNPNVQDGEVDLDELGLRYFEALDQYDKAEKHLNEVKSRVLAGMEGKKRGLIYGEHAISLRSRAGGLPYLHNELKGK